MKKDLDLKLRDRGLRSWMRDIRFIIGDDKFKKMFKTKKSMEKFYDKLNSVKGLKLKKVIYFAAKSKLKDSEKMTSYEFKLNSLREELNNLKNSKLDETIINDSDALTKALDNGDVVSLDDFTKITTLLNFQANFEASIPASRVTNLSADLAYTYLVGYKNIDPDEACEMINRDGKTRLKPSYYRSRKKYVEKYIRELVPFIEHYNPCIDTTPYNLSIYLDSYFTIVISGALWDHESVEIAGDNFSAFIEVLLTENIISDNGGSN